MKAITWARRSWPILVPIIGVAWFWTQTPSARSDLVLGGDLTNAPSLVGTLDRRVSGGSVLLFDTKDDEATIYHLQTDDLQVGTVGPTALARVAHQDLCELRVLGVLSFRRDYAIYGRSDRGVRRLEDLEGRRVGIPFGEHHRTSLWRRLETHGLTPQDVTPVGMEPFLALEKFQAGHLDALVVSGVLLVELEHRRIAQSVPLAKGRELEVPTFLVTTARAIEKHRPALQEILKSLVSGEVTPRESWLGRVADELGLPVGVLGSLTEEAVFSLSLTRRAVEVLEAEGSWLRRTVRNLHEAHAPDFQALVDASLLRAVAPERVEGVLR